MSTPLHLMTELMVQQSLEGLSPAEKQQLQKLRLENNVSESDLHDEMERIELAAAAADLACFDDDSSFIPDRIKDRVLVEAGKFFEAKTSDTGSLVTHKPEQPTPNTLGWKIATIISTAACILLLLNPVARTLDPAPVSVAQLRDAFLDSAPVDLIDVKMVSNDALHEYGKDLKNGRLVWSDAKQEGYMEFEGLKINDPKVEQYQLWIFQNEKLEKYPVDGGVFDITKDKQIIKIDAKILTNAKAFAVTLEKPGGVVVSDRERIPTVNENFGKPLKSNQSNVPKESKNETK